jgi:hypothetical protein
MFGRCVSEISTIRGIYRALLVTGMGGEVSASVLFLYDRSGTSVK